MEKERVATLKDSMQRLKEIKRRGEESRFANVEKKGIRLLIYETKAEKNGSNDFK